MATLQYVEYLILHGLITLGPPRTQLPIHEDLLFWDEIPPHLMRQRREGIADLQHPGEWILLLEEEPSLGRRQILAGLDVLVVLIPNLLSTRLSLDQWKQYAQHS